MKKLNLICIAFFSIAFMQAQTTPHTASDSSKKANHKSMNHPPIHGKQDSLKFPKGYYTQPKDRRGKDSNKVGSTPK